MNSILKTNYLGIVIVYTLASYLACAVEHYQLLQSEWLSWLVHDQMLTNAESSLFELQSAISWLIATLIFFYLLKQSLKSSATTQQSLWFGFYCLLSLFAFGEEISWGDHLLDYSHELEVIQINAQKETNIHNINLAQVLDISQDSSWYRLVKNAGYIATPLFYVILVTLWALLPIVKNTVKRQWKVLSQMPVPSKGFIAFTLLHAAVFIAIDISLFNVGQIFEMYIGLAAIIVALDMLKNQTISSD